MGYVSFKTLCKGTALLFFVILQGLNAQNSSTTENVSESTVITTTSSTESQTSTPTTENVLESTITTITFSTGSQTSTPTKFH
ncbi:putative mediator of RNA polymerase II transcription subunit 30 [Myxocyprinus asiaticus]|uniref:putative mediator of RNA polymerase II transcription subunit 30 n=1 Tax=Myxocyprinus asiaticus TaxID=70543 RepID=UPI00222276F3|nr:putative mediator of RNA polymerase II transcription subunit 30 [Myxocyprinus asiaticus]